MRAAGGCFAKLSQQQEPPHYSRHVPQLATLMLQQHVVLSSTRAQPDPILDATCAAPVHSFSLPPAQCLSPDQPRPCPSFPVGPGSGPAVHKSLPWSLLLTPGDLHLPASGIPWEHSHTCVMIITSALSLSQASTSPSRMMQEKSPRKKL